MQRQDSSCFDRFGVWTELSGNQRQRKVDVFTSVPRLQRLVSTPCILTTNGAGKRARTRFNRPLKEVETSLKFTNTRTIYPFPR